MQINIEEGEPALESFFFQPIPNKVLQEKSLKELLMKWGLGETLKVGSFRYSQHLQDYDIDRFLKDLFNNPNVRYLMSNINFKKQAISSVEFNRLRCHQLTLEMFDELEKEGIVRKGNIQKMMPQWHQDIQIVDKLRECLILEESENYCIFTEAQRKEFLFKIFTLLSVGGSFNQYEDIVQPYLDATKALYKSLVSVRKRAENSQIFVESQAFSISTLDKGEGYKPGYNPQNVLYVVVNPSIRTVHVLGNEWRKIW